MPPYLFNTRFGHYLSTPFSAIIGLGLLSSALLVLGGNDPLGTDPSREFLYTVLAFSSGTGAAAIIYLTPSLGGIKTSAILLLALAVRLIAIQAWPLLEDDYFRYLWDGRQTVLEWSPWRYAPAEFFTDDSLSAQWHSILSGINNPDLPTLYGPVLQYLFGLAYLMAPGELWPIQALLLLVDMAVFIVLFALGAGKRWLLVFAVHPLILKEIMASAHPDGVMVLFVLLALVTWRQQSALLTGVLLGLAITSKVSALIVVPFFLIGPHQMVATHAYGSWHASQTSSKTAFQFLRIVVSDVPWKLTVMAGVASSIVLLYLPFIQEQGSELTSLMTFGQEWRFNPLLYRAIDGMDFIAYPRIVAASLLILAALMAMYHWVVTAHKEGALRPYPPLDLAFFFLLFLSPVVNSWYWLWVLPFAVLNKRSWLVAFCCSAYLAYVNSHVFYDVDWFSVFNTVSVFEVPLFITMLQILLAGTLFIALKSRP